MVEDEHLEDGLAFFDSSEQEDDIETAKAMSVLLGQKLDKPPLDPNDIFKQNAWKIILLAAVVVVGCGAAFIAIPSLILALALLGDIGFLLISCFNWMVVKQDPKTNMFKALLLGANAAVLILVLLGGAGVRL